MKAQQFRTVTLIAAAVFALGAGTITTVLASNERGERGHIERSERDGRRAEQGRERDRDRVHREDREHAGRAAAATDGTALPIDALTASLKQQGYTAIFKIERKSGGFEVKASKENGPVVELWVNATTGVVEQSRLDD